MANRPETFQPNELHNKNPNSSHFVHFMHFSCKRLQFVSSFTCHVLQEPVSSLSSGFMRMYSTSYKVN